MNRVPGPVLAIACLLLCGATAYAQHTASVPAQVRGYVPKHLKVQGQPTVPAAPDAIVVPSSPIKQTSGVLQPVASPEAFVGSGVVSPNYHIPEVVSGHCGMSGPSGCQPSFWMSAEYLLWSTRESSVPALASTSTPGTDRQAAAVLDEPGVSTLFGNDGLHGDMRSGGRFTFGGWFSPAQDVGFEVSYLVLEDDTQNFVGNERQLAILGRPFFNLQIFEEDARLINFPNVVRGDLAIRASSDFDSLEFGFFKQVGATMGYTNLSLGYRQLNLDELVRFDETTTSLESPTLDSTFTLFDEFAAENEFHGGQISVHHVGQINRCWSFDLKGKASLGTTRSRVQVAGATTTTTSTGDVSTASGGLLALDSNIGTQSDSDFGSAFELGINLRRQFRNGWQFTLGYNYLHWSNVARAAEQIDRQVNPTQIAPGTLVGADRPRLAVQRSGFWAQGLSFGLAYQF